LKQKNSETEVLCFACYGKSKPQSKPHAPEAKLVRSDVLVCLVAMDVFYMPSRTEGFPNGLGEAMAMGLPCVATDVGDAKVLAGDTAVMVPANDVESLASGLLKVITLPEEQRWKMGLRAKVRVMSEFSIEKAREWFEMVYRDVLSSNA
jgi:glycosyltransferase involved in cell wall biosynthesis